MKGRTEDRERKRIEHGKVLLCSETSFSLYTFAICFLVSSSLPLEVNITSIQGAQGKHKGSTREVQVQASLVAQLVKNSPAMWETWVLSLGWEDSLEKGKATHSSILAWRIPWAVSSMGSQRVGHD